ncbi:TolC family protein [Flavobacterium sp.]|jgi:outer membrane protein TolC|uniref:TolC family protein n=1 Tax=Flavobacterium sp. TaxID=239 RepID=UPI0037C0717D
MKRFYLIFLFFSVSIFAQNTPVTLNELTYEEYLGYVKKFHPVVKSANLIISNAQANLMMARGGFDPKIEIDFDKKQFKNTDYYSILNSSFKIPTWYGIEIKAGFNNSEGVYLNPENSIPNQGISSFGISVPVGQGLLINQRMADIRKAKIQLNLSQAERKLQAISILYDASVAYFNWKRNYSEVQLYESYLINAEKRLTGVSSLILNGDKPAIDSVEANIIVRNRKLSLEDSRLKLAKSKLELSNFLWLENNLPLELQDTIIPEKELNDKIKITLKTDGFVFDEAQLVNHPKIKALENKIQILDIERKLKVNSLLPKINLDYQYLSVPQSFTYSNFLYNNFNDYNLGLNFYFPLFLRKERGSVKLAKNKIQDTQFELNLERVQLVNKIKAQQTEINSLEKQLKLINELVADYSTMLTSEDRLFSFGESSIFLINSRENNLIVSQLNALSLENRLFTSNAELFKVMANPD